MLEGTVTYGGPFLKTPGAGKFLGVSAAEVKRREKSDPTFPRGVQLSERVRVYDQQELNAWVKSKVAKVDANA